MGVYNPHVPQILGQEWVPIREDALTLTPRTNLLEVGHGFTVASNQTIQTARFYLQEWPPDQATSQVLLANVYRRGTETFTGPIRSVIIPCSLGTGAGVTLSGSAPTIASALFSPSDSAYVIVNTGTVPTITLRFDTESYLPQLIGKRILGIDFLYTYVRDEAGEGSLSVDLLMGSGANSTFITDIDAGLAPTNTSALDSGIAIGRQTVGEIDFYWQAPTISVEVLPWTPNRLRAFDNGSGLTERFLSLSVSPNPPTANQSIWFGYAAIEVFFCEEQRIMFGGRVYGSGSRNYVQGANQITMRDLSDAANPVLAAGGYDLVLASAELSAQSTNLYPELNQIQELYGIPSHPAVRIIRPFPLISSLGKTFTREETTLMPQVSLHTSSGPVTEVHVYGRQAAAQVYGNVTATQEILDGAAGGARSYPWVRYYARRFGSTNVPLKLDSPTITTSSVNLTPEAFDALDEIVNGWKEVTLRFDTPPSMGSGTNPQWRWSATGEQPGSRWEILGAIAPALSGAPFNPFNQVPSPHQLSLATYGAPTSGANINLGWIPQYAPPVSATVDDQTSDASLMFSLDMPTITGFGAEEDSQEVVGIGLDCGLNPCCIPTALDFVSVFWGLPPNTGIASDDFNRVEPPGGWGTASDGHVWTVAGTSANFSVTGGTGQVAPTTTGSDRLAWVNSGGPDQDVTVQLKIGGVSEGTGPLRIGLVARLTDSSNYYTAQLHYTSTQTVQLRISERVGGVGADLGAVTLTGASGPNDSTWYNFRFQVEGIWLRTKFWGIDQEEPGWMLEVTDTSLTTGNNAGAFVRDESTAAGPTIFYFDNFLVGPPDYNFGYYELQRMDTVTTEWQTIMKATEPATTGFNDYEARVGILSSYRIRAVNVYDFPGLWSTTVTATVPAPGVTIGCDDGHLLIFTSNERQDGSINLAYSSVWESGQVEESFAFPESRFVELQAMYNRDFFVAFRPTERGGEQFSRTVLVQAAAIAPETLADFTGLRDMAWADVSYICVRDEDGNRWFATVLVPSGRVLRDRRLYLAPVEVVEVTSTPSEVDP